MNNRIAIAIAVVLGLLAAVGVSFHIQQLEGDGNVREVATYGLYSVTEIDECEYLSRGVALVHKGNCKFCAERTKP